MPALPPVHEPPAPAPGTAEFFVLLYTPAAQRPRMTRLLAVAQELADEPGHTREPSVAAARLSWWQLEAQRYAAGKPQHPWLKPVPETPAAPPLDLPTLIDAAATESAESLRGALFVAAAELLGVDASSRQVRAALEELGARCWREERARRTPTPPLPESLIAALRPVQGRLAPLLVWSPLAARRSKNDSPWRHLADNVRAWRVARRATSARYWIE